jgi:hypothetical protein
MQLSVKCCKSAAIRVLIGTAGTLFVCPQARAQSADSTVTLRPQWRAESTAIPEDFAGLSYESAQLLPDKNKNYYFGPDRQTLIGVFRTLGVHSLRVGGNTADIPGVPSPRGTDIDHLFKFAAAAHVKVIYTLRLRPPSEPVDDAAIATYIMQNYSPQLDTFAVGNEPNIYYKTYDAYRTAEKKFIDTIRAQCPAARFSGPGTTGGRDYLVETANDLGKTGEIQLVTEHRYPGGDSRKVKDVAAARISMLSEKWVDGVQKFYDGFVPAVMADGLPYRMEETNSFYNGGARNVSDTFAAALWGLDYLYWWAEHHAGGVNFHTGDSVAAGDKSTTCQYASFVRDGDGYAVHPIGYALAAFELGSHGKLVPISLTSPTPHNVRAYGVTRVDGNFILTVINKEHDAAPLTLTADVGARYARADSMALLAPRNDLAATAGLTLGGATIDTTANWQGAWTALQPPTAGGKFTFTLPASSALVIRFVSQ